MQTVEEEGEVDITQPQQFATGPNGMSLERDSEFPQSSSGSRGRAKLLLYYKED